MPLTISDSSDRIALWHITEEEGELEAMTDHDACPPDIVNPLKRREWLAGRLAVRALVERFVPPYQGIFKDEFGKPHLVGARAHISLSHSFPYVAAQLAEDFPVGIDLEQPKGKLLNIAPRIMSQEELEDAGTDVVKHCIYWCAKEALYKIYGKRGLLFREHLNVGPFHVSERGDLQGSIAIGSTQLKKKLGYEISNDFVLVYTKAG